MFVFQIFKDKILIIYNVIKLKQKFCFVIKQNNFNFQWKRNVYIWYKRGFYSVEGTYFPVFVIVCNCRHYLMYLVGYWVCLMIPMQVEILQCARRILHAWQRIDSGGKLVHIALLGC